MAQAPPHGASAPALLGQLEQGVERVVDKLIEELPFHHGATERQVGQKVREHEIPQGPGEDVFLFVNPRSGGNMGQVFLDVPGPKPFIVNDVGGGRHAKLHIYSLLDGISGEKLGFRTLKQYTLHSAQPIRTIVGGGDGTVMWVDTEATKHGIDTPSQLWYGIVPLGTGNDFAREAGWGGRNPKKLLENGCERLKKLVRQWCAATPRGHDVWQVTLHVDEDDGDILHVNSEKEEASVGGQLALPMINYFSIGQESKVGIAFDKHRTKSQTLNKICYGLQGLVEELQCWSIQHIGNLVKSIHLGSSTDGRCILDCRGDYGGPSIRGNPESIIFQNINSYAGGKAHFWQQTVRKTGTKNPPPSPGDIDVDADPGDGKLEIVTLSNIAEIPLDQWEHHAKRVHSGGRSFFLQFNDPDSDSDEEDEGQVVHAYCEVDGEFYHLLNPSDIKIELHKQLAVLQKKSEGEG